MTEVQKPTGREVRVATETWPLAELEIRTDGDGMSFRGYAAVFNSWSEDLGGFREMIEPGAFTRTLKRDRNIRMFLNHNTDQLLATTKAGTLRLAEDEKGLIAEATLPDTTLGRDLATLAKRGDVDSMSFGFHVERGQKWSPDATERVLSEIRLFEVSPVTGWPAYTATSASVRELADLLSVEEDPLVNVIRKMLDPDPDVRLEDAERDLAIAAINARTDSPFVSATLADWRSRFAKKGYDV